MDAAWTMCQAAQDVDECSKSRASTSEATKKGALATGHSPMTQSTRVTHCRIQSEV